MSSVKPLEKLTGKIADVQKHKPADLIISRVPQKTIKEFKDLANEEFCKDYGMTLKWLMDGIIKADTQELLIRIEELEKRVGELTLKSEIQLTTTEKKKSIKLLNGKEILGGTEK